MKRFPLIALYITCFSIFAQGTGTVQFSESTRYVEEGIGDISIEVVRENSNLLAGAVEYQIIKSSATIVDDYEMSTSGQLNWGVDDTQSKFINISIVDDRDEEPDEVIVIRLFNPSEGTYVGDSDTSTITISGEEVGDIGFAATRYITSENDEFTTKILVSRRNGLKGAVLVDYIIREMSELDEDDHLGEVTHYRKLPEQLDDGPGVMSTIVPGVKAKAGSDFISTRGTLLFLDHQSSASFPVIVLPNFDGRAYPHTVVELALENPRPLTSIDQLEGIEPHSEDLATISYLDEIDSDPTKFVPENDLFTPTIDPVRQHASLRINDITGPADDLIWDGAPVPDQPGTSRVGFRFARARYVAYEGDEEMPNQEFSVFVLRSAPYDESVTVRYMVGPNRGFMVDDPRENWQNEDPKANPLTDSLENWDRIEQGLGANPNASPYTDSGDQLFGPTDNDNTDDNGRYAMQPGDEPRIMPDALYGNLDFGDFMQRMHNRELDIPLLNPGSDITSPTGSREFSPSFNKPLVQADVKRDFKVTTGTLTWDADDIEPKEIQIEIINDGYLEFNEDLVVVLYDPDLDKTEQGRDEAASDEDNDDGDGDGGDGDGDGGDGDGDGGDGNEVELLEPGAGLGIQYWATVTIVDVGTGNVAGVPDPGFAPEVNNDIYDMVVIRETLDSSTEFASEREEKIVVVGDFTSIDATKLNRIARVNATTGAVDPGFNPGTGANSFINSIALDQFENDSNDPDAVPVIAKYVIGGGFTSYNGKFRSGVARIEADGSLDESFDPGSGIEDGNVYDVFVLSGNQVLVVGEFTRVNGYKRNSIVRFNENGEVDETFDVGVGPDGPIYAVGQLPDGRIVIGGNFSSIGDFNARSIAVLDTGTGEPDPSFDIGTGVLGEIYAIDVNYDGRIVIGGSFSEVDGHKINNLAVIDRDGAIDELFDTGEGTDGPVFSVRIDKSLNVVGSSTFHMSGQNELYQRLLSMNDDTSSLDDNKELLGYVQGTEAWGGYIPAWLKTYMQSEFNPMYRIFISGDFGSFNQTRRKGLARLNPDGSIDTSFLDTAFNQFAGLSVGTSTSAPGLINSIALSESQPPKIYLAGSFNKIGGGERRLATQSVSNLAKLGAGETWGPGELMFEEDEYRVDEDREGGTITLRRKNGRRGFASAYIQTENLRQGAGAAIGDDISGAENPDYVSMRDRVVYEHYSKSPLISEEPVFVSWWSFWSYAEDFVDAMYYTYDPYYGVGGDLQGDYYRALLPHDFEPYRGASVLGKLPPQTFFDDDGDPIVTVSVEDRLRPARGFEGLGWQLQDGEDGIKTFDFEVYKDSVVEGDETVKLKLVLPKGYLNLGGEYIPLGVALGSHEAKMIIIDDDFTPGELQFSAADVYVNESEKTVALTVERINGSNGSISVQYKTKQGTAKDPFDFKTKQGSLRFASGQTSRPIVISLVDDEGQEADEFFDIEIYNATGGGKLVGGVKLLSMRVYLVDNDLKSGKVEFPSITGSIIENENEILVPVRRLGGSRGQASVAYTTSSVTALSNEDYMPKQGLLTWAHQDVDEKFIEIPIVDDELSEEEETFEVSLINPQGVIVGQKAKFTVNVVDDDFPGEVTLGQSSYFINENGAQLTVYVERQEGLKGAINVDYALVDGTAKSVGDFPDYTMESGTLSFEDGQVSQSINLIINDDYAAENTEFFSIVISNPTDGSILGGIVQAKVNIVDDESVNVPAGSIDTFFDTGVGIKVNGPVHFIKRERSGDLLISGEFSVVNGLIRNGIARLNPKGYLDREFDVEAGLDGLIKDILPFDDGSMIIVGEFNTINGVNKNYIAKLNSSGEINTRFDTGAGFDGAAHKIIPLNSSGEILVVGEFQNYNGKNRPGFVVLDAQGYDVSPWSSEFGTLGKVFTAAVLPDGSIYLGGDFEQFGNNTLAQKIVKLNPDGSLDALFVNNFSSIYEKSKFTDGHISHILMHPDGGLVLAGDFKIKTEEGMEYRNLIKITRDGALVVDYKVYADTKSGQDFVNGDILDAKLQPDGKLIIAGSFTEVNGRYRNRIARLTQEGLLDPTINFELGADKAIRTLEIQEDYRILIGGDFEKFNEIEARYISKIYGGINYGGGLVSFTSSNINYEENGTGSVITMKRRLGLTTDGTVKLRIESSSASKWHTGVNPYAIYDYVAFSSQEDQDFIQINFAQGEVFKEIKIISIKGVSEIDDLENMRRSSDGDGSIIYIIDDLLAHEGDESLTLTLFDFEEISPGPQSLASLNILNNDSDVAFSRVHEDGLRFDYYVDESSQEEAATITVHRVGATNRVVSVDYITSAGTARPNGPGQDYEDVFGTVVFEEGVLEQTIKIPLIDDFIHEGVESIVVELKNPKPERSATISGPDVVELMIDDSDKDLSRTSLIFEYDEYRVDETEGKVSIKVQRIGNLDETATVKYETSDLSAVGDEGASSKDYESVEGELVFKAGESEKTIEVGILDDYSQETIEEFRVRLIDASGAKLEKQVVATVLVEDREAGTVMFTRWNEMEGSDGVSWPTMSNYERRRDNTYEVVETEGYYTTQWYAGNTDPLDLKNLPPDGMVQGDDEGIRVTITRMEGDHGRILMDYATVDGSAKAGDNYVSQSGTLVMEEGQTMAHIVVPILPFGEWTTWEEDPLGILIPRTENYASFKLNLFNLRKDNGEPEYIKPKFNNQNWSKSGEISATIVVSRQPMFNPTPEVIVDDSTTSFEEGFYFWRSKHRVRESQGYAEIVVHTMHLDPAITCAWYAWPSDPLSHHLGHDWNANWAAMGYDEAPVTLTGGSPLGGGNVYPDGSNYPGWTTSPVGLHLRGYELSAGSDYAKPWFWKNLGLYTPEPVFKAPFPDANFISLGGIISGTFPTGQDTIIRIPLINNDDVDFNMDFFVALYDGQVGRWLGDVPLTIVTIVADGDLKEKVVQTDENGVESIGFQPGLEVGEAPAGSYDRNFNPHSQYDTEPAYNFDPGANNQVHAVAAQVDGKVLIGGDFTSYNSFPLTRIGRLQVDGSVDKGFITGTGADDSVESIEIRNDGRILVGGKFKSYNGHVSYGLVELNDDGSINQGFDVGTGFDDGVRDIKILENDKILVGGTFNTYNNTNAVYLARINVDGSIDHSFAPEATPGAPINAVDSNEDGSIIVVGEFEKVGVYTRKHIAKYKSDGRLDPDFESVEGANGIIHDVVIQPDGKIIIAGDFTRVNYVERSRIARLNPNGTVDRSFDPGTGFDATVYTIIQDQGQSRPAPNQYGEPGAPITNPDYMKIYAAGLFSTFDQVRRYGLARVGSNGLLDTTFMDNAFNQFAGIPRSGAQDPRRFIRDLSLTIERDLYIAGSFDKVGGGYSNFEKSPQNNITRIKGSNYGYYSVLPDGGLGQFIDSGETVGPGRIGFKSENYYADEFIGTHFIEFERQDGNLGAASVLAGMINPSKAAGMAIEGEDYKKEIKEIIYPTTWDFMDRAEHGFGNPPGAYNILLPRPMAQSIQHGGWQASDAFSGVNNVGYTQHDLGLRMPNGSFVPAIYGNTYFTDLNEWFVTINDDDVIEGNERIKLSLYQPKSKLYLGGANMNVGFALGRRIAYLTTIDDDFNHGVLRLSGSEYFVDESKRSVTIHLERVKGSNGQVSVELLARDITTSEITGSGYTKATGASLDSDYEPRKIDVTFEPEETSKSVTININNDTVRESDEVFIVELIKPKGGAVIDGPFANNLSKVIIVDDDFDAGVLTLVKSEYTVDEDQGSLDIGVRRIGGTQGLVEISYSIERVSESEGDDYEMVKGRLVWSNKDGGDKAVYFEIPDNDLVDEDQVYKFVLYDPVGPQSKKPRLSVSKATINVVNEDRYGEIAFSSSDYYVTENGGEFVVSVMRTQGLTGAVSVEYEVLDGTAKAGEDFIPSSGTLHFDEGQPSTTFTVQVLNENEAIDRNETVVLKLKNAQPRVDLVRRAVLGTPNVAVLNIIDDEVNNVPAGSIDTSFNQGASTDDFVDAIVLQDDGKFIIGGEFRNVNGLVRSRLARLKPDGEIDGTYNLGTGFDGPVRGIKITSDGKALVVGYFKSFNGRSRNGIARLNEDGVLDESFNPGGGADNPVNDLALQEDGRIIVVGEFAAFNGINRVRVARLFPDGSLDESFDGGIGPDGAVNSVDILPNGQIVVAGDFKTFNLNSMAGVALLEPNGELVESFSIGDGFNGSVKKVVAQSDLKLLVGGLFTQYQDLPANRVIRLMSDGSRDESFDIGSGANAGIYEVAIQPDGKIVLGGNYNNFNGLNKNGIVRLETNGTVDPTINFGLGANGSVLVVALKADYKMIIGGGFTEFNNQPREHFVQIHGGIIRNPGRLEFNFPRYHVNEKGTNATVQVVRTGGLIGDIGVTFKTIDNNEPGGAVAGLDYNAVDQKLIFPEGESIRNVGIEVIDDIEIEEDEAVSLLLSQFTENSEGLQSKSKLIISSDDSAVGFGSPLYSVTEGQDGSIARIEIQRIGALLGELELSFLTATNGTAQAKADFLMVSNKVQFADFETSKFVNVPVIDDNKIEPLESVVLILTNLVGNAFIKYEESKLNIIDNDFGTGDFSFEYPSFKVRENESFASIGIVRTNGFTGIVEMQYELGDLTATVGEDYASEKGKVVFSDGDYVQYIDIPLIDDSIKEGAEAFKLRLVKASGNAVITPPNFVNVIILDDETEDYISTISGRGTDGPVYTIESDRYGFVVGGDYSRLNNSAVGKLSYIDLEGNVSSLVEGGVDFNNAIYSTEILHDGILVGGLFNALGDVPFNRLVKLNPSGLVDENFVASSRINSTVYDTLRVGDHIYVGGAFGILKLHGDGSLDESFKTDSIIGSVYSLASTGDGILVAGSFVNANDDRQKNLLKISHSGGVDVSFELNESPDAPVYSVLFSNDSILIGGSFVTVNGISSRRIASLNSNGSSNDGFFVGTGFNKVVRKVQMRNDGNFIVSGNFDKWNAIAANKIVLLKPDGNLASNRFNQLSLNGTVYDTGEVPGKLFAFGGVFNESEETQYNGLGVVEAFTSPLPPELTFYYEADIGHLTVKGQPSQTHGIEYSLDLVNWAKLVNEKTDLNGEIKVNIDFMRFKSQYFRATMLE